MNNSKLERLYNTYKNISLDPFVPLEMMIHGGIDSCTMSMNIMDQAKIAGEIKRSTKKILGLHFSGFSVHNIESDIDHFIDRLINLGVPEDKAGDAKVITIYYLNRI